MVPFVALSLLLLGSAGNGLAAPAAQPPNTQMTRPPVLVPRMGLQPGVPEFEQASPPDAGIFLSSDTPDHVCLKIRAYIFRLNDDHAPRLVRETTCPNVRPRAKSAEGIAPSPGPTLENAVAH